MKVNAKMLGLCSHNCEKLCNKIKNETEKTFRTDGVNFCPIGLFGYKGDYSYESRRKWCEEKDWITEKYIDINIILDRISDKELRNKILSDAIDYKLMIKK